MKPRIRQTIEGYHSFRNGYYYLTLALSNTITYPNVEGEMLTKEWVLREKIKQWLMGRAVLRHEDNKIRAQYILHVASAAVWERHISGEDCWAVYMGWIQLK